MLTFRKSTLAVLATLVACLAAAPALALVEYTWDTPVHVIVDDEFAFIEIYSTITNTGDERDTYDIHKEQLVPDDLIWSASICVGDFCYAPNVNDVSTGSIDPGGTVDIGVAYFFGTEPGTGYSSLRVSSQSAPGLEDTQNFVAIHSGCDVLAVDDTGDAFLSFDHMDAIRAQLGSRFAGHWPRALQEVDLGSLQAFPATLWITGENGETLDAADRAVLGDFLGGGGSLLVSGDEVGFDLCDPASPNYSTANVQWVADNLDAGYEADFGDTQVDGLAGSDLGDGLSFTLNDPMADPDVIRLTRAGAAQFGYGTGGTAGILSTGTKRVAFLGFDLADLDAASLGAVLDNALTALAQPSASDTPALPAALTLLPNQPNPFNPKTTLRFRAPADGLARVDVLDLQGRQVASFRVPVTAGENAVPFTAVDASGHDLASGTYFTRVSLGGEVATGKMTLLK
ncbi:MAG: T9SS type A sorting domain-containing protein [Candidatus Krumholzibacteriia bacterium]|nr:T9SS type A sorting domain-containing protein [bacterium]